jgi:hypothetical protein
MSGRLADALVVDDGLEPRLVLGLERDAVFLLNARHGITIRSQ